MPGWQVGSDNYLPKGWVRSGSGNAKGNVIPTLE